MSDAQEEVLALIEEAREQLEPHCTCTTENKCQTCRAIRGLYDAIDALND
mgnify:CR=1 FL=1